MAVRYLLCGLPIVATAEASGNSEFLEKSNSIFVERNSGSVDAGVAEGLRRLATGAFSRIKIREGAFARIVAFRDEFIRDIARVLKERGVDSTDMTAQDIFNRGFSALNDMY